MMLKACVSAVLLVTLGCASPSPSPPAPSGPAQATRPLVAGERNGIVIELELDRGQARVGDVVVARVRLTNRGPITFWREGNTCGSGPAPVTALSLAADRAGRQWDGLAAEFKRLLLQEAGGVSEDGVVIGRFWDSRMGEDSYCTLESNPEQFGPGDTDELTVAWRVRPLEGMVIEPGPAVVRASFSSLAQGEPREPDFEFSVEAPLEIVGDQPADQLTVADYADIALANPEYAAWLADKPRETWVNTLFTAWPTDSGSYPEIPPFGGLGRRPVMEVGLAVFPEAIATVLIDQATGEVVATRFE